MLSYFKNSVKLFKQKKWRFLKMQKIIYVVREFWDRNDYEEFGTLSGAYLNLEDAEKVAKAWEEEDEDHYAYIEKVPLHE